MEIKRNVIKTDASLGQGGVAHEIVVVPKGALEPPKVLVRSYGGHANLGPRVAVRGTDRKVENFGVALGKAARSEAIVAPAVQPDAAAPKNQAVRLRFTELAPEGHPEDMPAPDIEHEVPLSQVVAFKRISSAQVEISVRNDDGTISSYRPRSFMAATASVYTAWKSNIDSISDLLLHNQLELAGLAALADPNPSMVAQEARDALVGLSDVSYVWWQNPPVEPRNKYEAFYAPMFQVNSGVFGLDRLVRLEPVGDGKFKVTQKTFDGERVLAEAATVGAVDMHEGKAQRMALPSKLIDAGNVEEVLRVARNVKAAKT